jgi:hypothetical protein
MIESLWIVLNCNDVGKKRGATCFGANSVV